MSSRDQKRFASPPRPAPEQFLLLQSAQLSALMEQCRSLAASLARSGRGGPFVEKPRDAAAAAARRATVRQFALEKYLPGRNHPPSSATAEITRDFLTKLDQCFGRELLLRELRDPAVERFRAWLFEQISREIIAPPTANKYLRQLRAIANYAARKKLLRAISPIDFFEEQEPEILPWTPDQLAAIERRAAALEGFLGGEWNVAERIFWTAFCLVQGRLGCRITAMMLARRVEDYDAAAGVLTLRAATQKSRKTQRFLLPRRAAEAVEALLATHGEPRIFGCWPHDPITNGRPKWKTLAQHFERKIIAPLGLTLQHGVKTRQFRRTVATIVEDADGDPQELLGHSNRSTTEKYLPKTRKKIIRGALLIPETSPQRELFS